MTREPCREFYQGPQQIPGATNPERTRRPQTPGRKDFDDSIAGYLKATLLEL